ncbi:DAK2 domain-containing protein [Nocardioides yefusunii]|uniref:DAK2 domain-containing protein n=1 Tax=Nocardioides yefusunii TaxID=2500546 RepID=A0ABW1QVA6_9ACTN|nr:DAK2 domain-containing protein [Nocardioides yefusunii]
MERVPDGIALDTVLRFVDVATDALSAAREEIDALNVYPVPDGDTGTNMFLTFSAAREAIRTAADNGAEVGPALAEFRRAALMGARGNSGVILSQLIGAVAARLERGQDETYHPGILIEALQEATEASYAAVGVPVEGTILTVSRAASDAAAAVAERRTRDGLRVTTGAVFGAAAAAAREALARTPQQLQALADAGVVDAGGRGLTVILDAAERVLTGRTVVGTTAHTFVPRIPVPVASPAGHGTDLGGDLTEEGPAYEVMYLLDATESAVATLRTRLGELGDSLVVVGAEGLWNVHVHVDDVGAAIEAGIEAGRPHRIRVTHFADQVEHQHGHGHVVEASRRGRRVVAVTAGPGLRDLFAEAGAQVVAAGPGLRPSAGEIHAAIEATGAAEVIVLPNDPDSVRVAEIAARTAQENADLRVSVIPTHAQVQGLAALAVHEPARSFEADVLEMTATARHTRHGAVTVAAKQAITTAGPCEPGDALGVIDGDFAIVGTDLLEVSTGVVSRLLGAGGDLVTLVSGAGAGADELAQECAARVEETHPLADVVVYAGGQERYQLLISVE